MNQVVENLRGFLARVESAKYNGGEDSLGKEFQEIKNRSAAFRQEGSYSTDTGGSQENLKKNRYKDILPYDQTRVPVTLLEEDAGSDYINASFIQGVDKQPRYIATQGPLSHTVLDFWRMIWQYNVKVIVMACREVELGKKKCERYWPLDQETVQYGVFTVSTVSKVIVNPEVVFRNLAVYFQEEVREVGHFQYIAWPDRGIPDSYTCFLKMIQLVRRHQGEHKAPMCVHCSAGCGRTGVICTVEYIQSLLDKQRVPSDFSIFEVVMEMRRQRPSAVQTKEQYDFLYHAITEMFEKQLKEYYSYENLQEYKAPFYADAGALKTTNRIQIHTRQKDVGLRVSLPPAQPEMSNIYAVVNKKATAQVSSPGIPSYNHQKLENKWSQPVSSAYAEVSDRPDKSLDNYETVTDSSKGCMPAAISGIGFNCRIGKPKGPRDPPAEWSR
ncbi:tyrosine-protein phosphatase non-receptor type 18 isoform X3 [Bufo gargarizans]|uniref:tyrosine-protein phosphatase non-receptor type 18 isoform X3 n=1 Tax=Bufo gargarizans TaxID=30331 RepID=UPI001CF55EF8|nr:tyrosine-protein phosphatase non-receptor type 18 isoform X3 [Bufo gargarizans]